MTTDTNRPTETPAGESTPSPVVDMNAEHPDATVPEMADDNAAAADSEQQALKLTAAIGPPSQLPAPPSRFGPDAPRPLPRPGATAPSSLGTAESAPRVAATIDLKDPSLYLSRELTWLRFNARVLNEARDPRTPLLERVKFLAIFASNMDEFFMKRIGGLKQQIGAGVHKMTPDGRTPTQQLAVCRSEISALMVAARTVFHELIAELAKENIRLVRFADLSEDDQARVRDHFDANVFPLITPLAIDPAHPFPFISNLSLNLLVTLRLTDEAELTLARIKVPVGNGVRRFVAVDTPAAGEIHRFVMLEDVIAHCLDDLFPGMDVETVELFRVTRNANTERDEDTADDLLAMIEAELRDRKFAPIVRLETAKGIDPGHRGMLAAELGLNEGDDVYVSDIMLAMRDLMELAAIDRAELHDPPHEAITNVRLQDGDNIFHILRRTGPILLHHPYESFVTSVTRFVREAATDPKVLAIKMTLYRTSADTQIIDHLIEAATNGKQVAVVVELKARFDEAANIRWATRLEEAGIHVTYGVVGLKTHCKLILIVRRDYTGLRRYVHVGTGNYHAGTARLYCDLGLLTADPDVARDVTELFNYLTTGCRPTRIYRKILASPNLMKRGLLQRIEREITVSTPEAPGLIRLKTNALEDPDITEALYRASRTGVIVQLFVRDTCRLRPGLPGVSETIGVISIVGRFLEHARVYYFQNGGDEEYFIGSADLMRRNLESRVEVIVPIEPPTLRRELAAMFEFQMRDHRSVWDMQPDGSYVQRQPRTEKEQRSSQELLITAASLRHERWRHRRKMKPRAYARRNPR